MGLQKSEISGQIVVTKDYTALSQVVAAAIADQLAVKPTSCLGLPVGKSITGCYEILSNQSEQKKIDWHKSKCFALDDYLEVDEQFSFQNFLQTRLYRQTNLEPNFCFNPRFQDHYDQLIEESGGLDLCILGIGRNGHIAFNEPGTPKASWTHCVWLSESTMKANQDYFANAKQPATKAITMGISTILAARKILLVATGQGKKDILNTALCQTPTASVPASFLTLHPNLLIVTDFHYLV